MQKNTVTFLFSLFLVAVLFSSCADQKNKTEKAQTKQEIDSVFKPISISENHRYFVQENGDPFFWLGDTGWLMFNRLDREQIKKYIEDRKAKKFNVIQAMVLHSLDATNIYKDSALVKQNVANVVLTEGANPSDSTAYDFWDHVDYAVKTAEENNIYMAMVPVWGGNIENVTEEEAREYAKFLAERYKDNPNVIWLNGGDTFGNEYTNVWNAIGATLNEYNPEKLITFHPRGRHDSSDWFQHANWMDFNMFQSGHRTYAQDDTEKNYGEDNWRYVKADYNLKPTKPTLDGEPSYEGIPYGLHDTLQPFWKAPEIRRYAYWSVFAGAAGFTYGHSAVMQMHRPQDKTGAYGNKKIWTEALNDPGARQMQYVKKLMLDYPYFNRKPDTTLVLNSGDRYDYLPATTGDGYSMVYTYTGRNIKIDGAELKFKDFRAFWYDPRTGRKNLIKQLPENQDGTYEFNPEGEEKEGNDWILILEKKA